MNINDVVTAIEDFLRTYAGNGTRHVGSQVRPSGDDVDVIKIWIDLGGAHTDPRAWATACEAAIRKAVPSSQGFRIEVRAEKD